MKTHLFRVLSVLVAASCFAGGAAQAIPLGGRLTGNSSPRVTVWWALSSAAKIRPEQAPPDEPSEAVHIRCARNEGESVQVLVRPEETLRQTTVTCDALVGPGTNVLASGEVEILKAVYLNVTTPTDASTKAGRWPDPLVPVRGALDLEGGINHAFWLRLHVPAGAAPGAYRGALRFQAQGWEAEVPVELTVYDFTLPDTMTCQTAFGFSPQEVFRYQHLQTEEQRREVLEKYWADLSAHHISPSDPAPLDPFQVKWPEVHPPKTGLDSWHNARLVENERHSGKSALLVYDDKPNENVVVTYEPLIPIPKPGLHLRGWYRTAVPGHRFTVSLNHYDAAQKWISGHNLDFTLTGNGQWQEADYMLREFPPGAKYVRLNLMGAVWSESGENIGLVWYDDISVRNAETGEELIRGGDFEREQRTEPCLPAEQLRATFDFTAWDRAMTRAIDHYHFNSFATPVPGLGGGTFYELAQPNLMGLGEDTPEYPLLLGSYCRQLEDHLRAKGWLDRAYIYWFDEPSEDQFPYLQNGFAKLKRYCPDIPRMITKLVEPGLVGGPNVWCPISDQFQPKPAAERRKLGERFWWYVCTGPKAPYTGLFLDHAAPEMRIWLWQTFQRDIQGVLVWQCNYWTSGSAYPEAQHPQNPYADPMSWTSGYGTPAGRKLPWGNGDGRFIYPPLEAVSAGQSSQPVLDGPVDSIRWEQLRDGIEDYEYLTILRHRLAERRAGLDAEAVRRYENLLVVPETITRSMTEFARDGSPIEIRRDEIARAIEELR